MLMSIGTLAGYSVMAGSGAVMAGLLIFWRLVVDFRSGTSNSARFSSRRQVLQKCCAATYVQREET
jgi:hypothetical protein